MELVILLSVFLMCGCYLNVKGEKGFGAGIILLSALMFAATIFTMLKGVGL